MAAVLRKRKIIDTGFGDAGIAAQRQPRILHFGRLSKPGIRRLDKETKTATTKAATYAAALNTETETQLQTETEPKKRKLEHGKDRSNDKDATPPLSSSPSSSSRTRPVTPPPFATTTTTAATASNATTTTKTTTQRKTRLPPSQPGETRRIAPLKKSKTSKKGAGPTVAESPTQGARAILEAFVLAAPVSEISGKASIEENTTEDRNPSQELVALHASFLNALSLHYAHEGTSTPADLRQLAISITRIWGRRRVTTEDIRRVLGVQQWKSVRQSQPAAEETDRDLPGLVVSDFGKGRVCIEFDAAESHGAHASPLPVPTLKRIFARNLLALGERELPLAPIVPYTSLCSTSATSTGATRLADLKASAVNAQANTARSEGLAIAQNHKTGGGLLPSSTPSTVAAAAAKPASRGASLLERICAKEAHAASQPAAPTAAALARKAALQRLEEIIPVIEILARRNNNQSSSNNNNGNNSNSKVSAASSDLAAALGLAPPRNSSTGTSTNTKLMTVSFTMPALVQHLQQSLRHPLAKDEGELCIRLLATDVLPRWVQLHTLQSRWTSVAVRGAVSRAEWLPKLRSLLDEE